MNKDLRAVLAAIEAAGFQVVRTKGGHYAVLDEDGITVTVFAGTASDRRSVLNSLSPLKRRGFRWPPRR